MKLFIGQDWHGNIHICDDRDQLPPDLTDFHEVWLPDYARHSIDATLEIEIEDYCESISLNRNEVVR